jgi:hypothetical protein
VSGYVHDYNSFQHNNHSTLYMNEAGNVGLGEG